MATASYIILWKFRVKEAKRPQFEKTYGSEGDWAQLFRKSVDYIGTELYQDSNGTYLTIDEWTSQEAFEKFKEEFAKEYRALDKMCEDLTEEEIPIGSTVRSIP